MDQPALDCQACNCPACKPAETGDPPLSECPCGRDFSIETEPAAPDHPPCGD